MVRKTYPGEPYRQVVADILNQVKPKTILDAPSGCGWLQSKLNYRAKVDGLDLFEPKPDGYFLFLKADLSYGLPDDLPTYESIISCEGIEHIGNPSLFLETVAKHLVDGGLFIVTTRNSWYPESKLKYLLRGFFCDFPCYVGCMEHEPDLHIMPWSFPQLYLYLKLNGFDEIQLHEVYERKPKRIFEKILGLPQDIYCRFKLKNADTEEKENFWRNAGSSQSLYGRCLVVSARFAGGKD